MLTNLDNEVHLEDFFTDVEVFKAFVKDTTTRETIKRILRRGKATIQEIAEDVDVSIEYVQRIKNDMI